MINNHLLISNCDLLSYLFIYFFSDRQIRHSRYLRFQRKRFEIAIRMRKYIHLILKEQLMLFSRYQYSEKKLETPRFNCIVYILLCFKWKDCNYLNRINLKKWNYVVPNITNGDRYVRANSIFSLIIISILSTDAVKNININ